MKTIGLILQIIGWGLVATPIWYTVLMELLFRCGIGYCRDGKLRRVRLTEWLSATGTGVFLAPFFIVLGRTLSQHHDHS